MIISSFFLFRNGIQVKTDRDRTLNNTVKYRQEPSLMSSGKAPVLFFDSVAAVGMLRQSSYRISR